MVDPIVSLAQLSQKHLSPMPDLCATLLELLERQLSSDGDAPERIAEIARLLCGERVFRDPALTPQQVRAMELLLAEWSDMFSFKPGRADGLPHLIKLLETVCRRTRIEQLELYSSAEWLHIVSLRGPVETVQLCECMRCQRKYPGMGMSGFLDLTALVCESCGDVVFGSFYEDKEEAVCPCGGVARGCPSCGADQARVLEEISPYQYFADHQFVIAA